MWWADDVRLTRNNGEEVVMVYFGVLLRHVRGVIDQNNEKPLRDIRCPTETGSRHLTYTSRHITTRDNVLASEERTGFY